MQHTWPLNETTGSSHFQRFFFTFVANWRCRPQHLNTFRATSVCHSGKRVTWCGWWSGTGRTFLIGVMELHEMFDVRPNDPHTMSSCFICIFYLFCSVPAKKTQLWFVGELSLKGLGFCHHLFVQNLYMNLILWNPKEGFLRNVLHDLVFFGYQNSLKYLQTNLSHTSLKWNELSL